MRNIFKTAFYVVLFIGVGKNIAAASIKEDQARTLGSLALLLGDHSWELVNRYKGDKIKVLSSAQQAKVVLVKDTVDVLLQQVADQYNSGQQDQAVEQFSYKLSLLAKKMGASYGSYSKNGSIDQYLASIEKSVNGLVCCYKSLNPVPPFYKRAEDLLFYNSFTTEIVPTVLQKSSWLLFGLGGVRSFGGILQSLVGAIIENQNPIKNFNELKQIISGKKGTLAKDAMRILFTNFKTPVLLWGTGYLLHAAQHQKYQARLKLQEKQLENLLEKNKIAEKIVSYEREVTFATLKGLSDTKEHDLKLVVDYLKNPFKYIGIQKKGTFTVLLYGPPGTGKTLSARAIAGESGAPFVEINADDIFSDTAKDKILQSFEIAKNAASARPEKSALIYIDELDCVSTNREAFKNGTSLDADRAKALANLLTLLDGVNAANPYVHIVIVMTTNHWKSLDPALMRPGRIDRKIGIGFPDENTRYEFIKDLIKHPINESDLKVLAQKTDGYTGAYLVNMINGAKLQALYAGTINPSMHDYEMQIERISAEIQATDVKG